MRRRRPKRRRRKRRNQRIRIIRRLVIAVIVLILIAALVFFIRGKIAGKQTDAETWFAEYTGSSSGTSDGSGDASSNSYLVLNHQIRTDGSLIHSGECFVSLEIVQDELNGKFYWDENESLLIYTSASTVYQTGTETSEYYVDNTLSDAGYTIVRVESGTVYVNLEFVSIFTDIEYTTYESPLRLVVVSDWSSESVVDTKKKTRLMRTDGIGQGYLITVSKGQTLTVLEEGSRWTKVVTDDGLIGYVRNKAIGDVYTRTYTRTFEATEYSNLRRDYDINLTWHQVSVSSANSNISSVLEEADGINVICPTWINLSDDQGNIDTRCSADYVQAAHRAGVEVWALVSNLENEDVTSADTTTVLTSTTSRTALENKLIAAAIEYDLDGLNIDFESMESEVGDSFIQFIRELSILCRRNNLVLSVDIPPSLGTTEYYARAELSEMIDYVILMAYDEHYSGSSAGSVASITWVEESVAATLEEVDPEALILGMPFYTRLWELSSDGGEVLDSYAYGMDDMTQLLAEQGVSAAWNESSGQYFAEYSSGSNLYQVWLEDADSIALKLGVMQDYGLAGCATWRVGYESDDIWAVISAALDN